MNDLPHLIVDLEKLNVDYLELSKWGFPKTKEHTKKQEERYTEAGKLFVDFYNNVFVPRYSKSTEIPTGVLDKVGEYLSTLSSTASRLIDKGTYGALSALLIDRGMHDRESNNLERLIQNLKKTQ